MPALVDAASFEARHRPERGAFDLAAGQSLVGTARVLHHPRVVGDVRGEMQGAADASTDR